MTGSISLKNCRNIMNALIRDGCKIDDVISHQRLCLAIEAVVGRDVRTITKYAAELEKYGFLHASWSVYTIDSLISEEIKNII